MINRSRLSLVLCCAIVSFSGTAAADDSCEFSATRNAKADGAAITKVVMSTGAGALIVRGDKSRKTIDVTGRACASKQEFLDQIQIDTRREGNVLYLKTRMPDLTTRIFGNSSAVLDLTIDLPAAVATEIEDSSGSAEIRGVRGAVVADSSGDLKIVEISGDLRVEDSSGEVLIDFVDGNVQVTDSSGAIKINKVTGNVDIPIDSSGAMILTNIGGSVHVTSDTSGDIIIEHVEHNVTIDSDSSGGIRVSDIGGNFTVGADSGGGIEHTRVAGKVQIPTRD